jgi:2-polyprenyl-3-methyl-5-hydroxy-6-metoxy-1,4-benzoquinol methylase
MFAEQGFNVVGLDVLPENVNWVDTSLGIDTVCGNAEDIGQYFPSKTFDLITAFALLQHLRDPAGFVKQCLAILKPGGKLVLLLPIADSVCLKIFGKR